MLVLYACAADEEGGDMKRFEAKVALITGAASGIGRATAERLASEGARLICADVQAEAVEDTAKRAREAGAEAEAVYCDVSDPSSVAAAVRTSLDRFGELHVLCNIAGILQFGHTHEFELDAWNRILGINLTGTFLMCREAIPHLLENRGCIVNTASTAALAGHPWTAAYSASKGGVLALTYGLAIEYGKQGLRANAVCPGSIETPISDAFELPDGADRKLLHRIMPLDQFRGPETVASAVAFLASEDAAHINGVGLRMDGAALS
jgi:NAD(P)-dependent dehydrogenase (short-subunit alcohol dehydrogenase family)